MHEDNQDQSPAASGLIIRTIQVKGRGESRIEGKMENKASKQTAEVL